MISQVKKKSLTSCWIFSQIFKKNSENRIPSWIWIGDKWKRLIEDWSKWKQLLILSGVGIAQTTRQTAMIPLAGNSWLFRQFWALPCLSTLSWFFNFHPSLNILLRKSFGLSRFWCFLTAVFMSSSKIKPCQWLKGPSVFLSVSTQSTVKSSTFLGSLVWSI